MEPVSLTLLVTDDGPGIPDQRTRTELTARYRRVYAEPGGIVSGLEPPWDVGTRVSACWSAAGAVEHRSSGGSPGRPSAPTRIWTTWRPACAWWSPACWLWPPPICPLAYAIDERLQVTPTLLIYGAPLVVLGLLRHLIARAGAEAAIDQREREREAVAEARAANRSASARVSARRCPGESAAAVGDGRRQRRPRSAAVRARAAVAELYVRALLTLAPWPWARRSRPAMARWAGEAQESGVQLAVAWSDERGGTDADGRDRDRRPGRRAATQCSGVDGTGSSGTAAVVRGAADSSPPSSTTTAARSPRRGAVHRLVRSRPQDVVGPTHRPAGARRRP